ncbi:EcsC family protein [Sedimentibacter sp.]|uniref:EcsC family protein n=1 Tax=Sedimentibacter sp. TaxID=1960295 RepID=UPI00289C4EF1|nr:EcsC family protein [Sedimentibacter sp.]
MDIIKKHLNKLAKKEKKILNKKQNIIEEKLEPLVDKVESKVPKSLKDTLDTAFYKSFKIVFEKGTKYIEKLYNKNKIQFNHNVNDYHISKRPDKKAIKKIDKHAQKSKFLNTSISAIEGAGLGFLGIGLPDIPLFTAMILKTIYEISLSYGFMYEMEEEKIYVLNIIKGALTSGETQQKYNLKVDKLADKIDNHINIIYDLDREIIHTARIISESMLTSKFIQGIPVVGVLGSITNYKIINKISEYASVKYKKRYLHNRR